MLVPAFETLGVVAVALAAWYAGRRLGRLQSRWWAIGYVVPLVLLMAISIGRRFTWLEFTPPLSWLMIGRMEFVLLAVVICLLMSTLLQRVDNLGQKRALRALMVLAVAGLSVFPFLAPGLLRGYHLGMENNIDENGICRQTSDYTCGPASAVTALRYLDLPEAREGELAVLGYTSRIAGTPPDLLRDALNRKYADRGVAARVRVFEGIEGLCAEIDKGNIVLAVVKAGVMTDHYVAVLDCIDGKVVLGDPDLGLRWQENDEFLRSWRYVGVVVSRRGVKSTFRTPEDIGSPVSYLLSVSCGTASAVSW